MQTDKIEWKMHARVLKYEPGQVLAAEAKLGRKLTVADVHRMSGSGLLVPDDIVEIPGNATVDVGKQRLGDLFTGTGQAFTTARGVTGVGNSSTANASNMTALQGASQFYKGLDGAPNSVTGSVSASTTFLGSEANFDWNEWCWAIATAAPTANASFATATTSGVMINRKVQTLGTKAVNAVWTLAASVSIG